MLNSFFFGDFPNVMIGLGALCAFLLTAAGLKLFMDRLPADEGREFAVDGKLSRGKPRGAGIIFIFAFAIAVVLFAPFKPEYLIYTGLIIVEMLTGYLDDAAKKPWGRVKKGLLDLFVSLVIAFTYVHYNGTDVTVCLFHTTFSMNRWILYILAVILVWTSINVTNCADGVDALSGTLAIVTMLSFYIADIYTIPTITYGHGNQGRFVFLLVFFMAALLAYLWYNASPSILMMGDAGSRAMGVFISILALKSHMPFLYLVFALVIFLDGGLGLFKVTFIKLFHKNPMEKIRTPLHDHVRKNVSVKWSNEQVVMRFASIQAILSIIYIYLFLR